jgi:hypothetical protein
MLFVSSGLGLGDRHRGLVSEVVVGDASRALLDAADRILAGATAWLYPARIVMGPGPAATSIERLGAKWVAKTVAGPSRRGREAARGGRDGPRIGWDHGVAAGVRGGCGSGSAIRVAGRWDPACDRSQGDRNRSGIGQATDHPPAIPRGPASHGDFPGFGRQAALAPARRRAAGSSASGSGRVDEVPARRDPDRAACAGSFLLHTPAVVVRFPRFESGAQAGGSEPSGIGNSRDLRSEPDRLREPVNQTGSG